MLTIKCRPSQFEQLAKGNGLLYLNNDTALSIPREQAEEALRIVLSGDEMELRIGTVEDLDCELVNYKRGFSDSVANRARIESEKRGALEVKIASAAAALEIAGFPLTGDEEVENGIARMSKALDKAKAAAGSRASPGYDDLCRELQDALGRCEGPDFGADPRAKGSAAYEESVRPIEREAQERVTNAIRMALATFIGRAPKPPPGETFAARGRRLFGGGLTEEQFTDHPPVGDRDTTHDQPVDGCNEYSTNGPAYPPPAITTNWPGAPAVKLVGDPINVQQKETPPATTGEERAAAPILASEDQGGGDKGAPKAGPDVARTGSRSGEDGGPSLPMDAAERATGSVVPRIEFGQVHLDGCGGLPCACDKEDSIKLLAHARGRIGRPVDTTCWAPLCTDEGTERVKNAFGAKVAKGRYCAVHRAAPLEQVKEWDDLHMAARKNRTEKKGEVARG